MNKLAQKLAQRPNDLLIWLRPQLIAMPYPVQSYDDPFLPFGKLVITAAEGLAAGFVFDLAAYLAIGAAGAVALERTIAFAPKGAVTILHGPFATADYAQAVGSAAFNVDAVTVSDMRLVDAYHQAGVEAVVVTPAAGITALDVGGITLKLVPDDVLYTDRGEHFVDAFRSALRAYRDA